MPDNEEAGRTAGRIRVLEDEVASKIAAGEVIERPSSVVKELVENSLDSGADRVSVEIEEAGVGLIRVTDNGFGMTADEAVLALQRHATSKISSVEDLATIRTLGFRGEALPSISAVSNLELQTRPPELTQGCRVLAEAGVITALDPLGCPAGTSISVRDLFFNTPARRKFLKSPRTEVSQILEVAIRMALSRPGVRLDVVADGEELLRVPAGTDPREAVAAIYGPDPAREMADVAHSRPGIAVEGVIGLPVHSRPTRSAQHVFVNGRWIRSRVITHAIDEACAQFFPPKRHSYLVLHLELDPGSLDVNVHPAKTEVRFLRDWEVHRAVGEALRAALGNPRGAAPLLRSVEVQADALARGVFLQALPEAECRPPRGERQAAAVASGGATLSLALATAAPDAGVAAWKPVAQLWERYILAHSPEGLVIVDQHLAHERVLFDRLIGDGESGNVPARTLDEPLTLAFSHAQALRLDELSGVLAGMGLALEPFGRDAILLRTVPSFVPAGRELQHSRDILDEVLTAPAQDAGPEALRRLVASAACRTAVKKGSALGLPEMQRVLADLAGTTNPNRCPHGCPIWVGLSFRELLSRFKRA